MVWGLATIASAAAGLIIESGAPDSLCPDLSSTRQAVEARLGAVEPSADRPWKARYTIVHAEGEGDYIRLELFDAQGERRLVRDLPMAGETCSTMAQIIALVLDRFFRDLGAPEPEVAPRAEPTPKAPPQPTPPAPEPIAPPPANFTPTRPVVLGLWGGVGGEPLGPSLAASLRVSLSEQWQVGVLAAWLTGEKEAASVGSGDAAASLRAMAGRGFVAWTGHSGRFEYRLGPEFLIQVEHASASQEVRSEPYQQSAYRVRPGLGVHAGAAVWLLPQLALAVTGAVDASSSTRRFLIRDETQSEPIEVLKPSIFQGLFVAGLELSFR